MRKLKSKTEVPEQRDITAWEMTVLLALSFLLFIISRNFFFFWDNITQLSVPANYYFDSKFATLYVPDEITTGHQPFVGMYFAAGWHLLGRTLFASHLLMLPVVFGVLFQLYRLSGIFLKEKKQQWIALTILVMESTLLSQLSLLTFEVFHVFFFLATINALLRNKNWWGALFFSGLMLVSLRATMSGIGLVLSVLLYQIFILKKFAWQQYIPFLPGVLLFIIFQNPHNIGNGIFGGLLPAISTYFVSNAQSEGKTDFYLEGLWYPIIIGAICFVIGVIYITKKMTSRYTD